MKLLECYIENFGTISGERIVFTDGLNCIRKDNGEGKTTLSVFLKAMLYGLSDTKKVGIEENERKHYLPWQGGAFGGSLTFVTGGRTYRAERSFSQKPAEDSFRLYDVARGTVCDDLPENLGEALFGIDADGFERTVFLSERALSPKTDNKSIAAKLSDLVGADGDIGVMDDAMKVLENQRKMYFKKGGSGKIAETRAELSSVERQLEELDSIRRTLPEKSRAVNAAAETLAGIEKENATLSEQRAAAAMRQSEAEYAKRYENMRRELARAEERKQELYEFFSGKIPTFREVEEAAYRYERATQMMKAAENTVNNDSDELRFAGATPERAAEARILLREATALEEKIKDERFGGIANPSAPIPTGERLAQLKERALKKAAPLTRTPALATFLTTIIVGIALGIFLHPALLALCGVGAAFLVAGLVVRERENAEHNSLCGELRGIVLALGDATDLQADADVSHTVCTLEALSALRGELSELVSERDAILDELTALLSGFGVIERLDTEAVAELLSDYDGYAERRRIDNARRDREKKDAEIARGLMNEAKSFIGGIRTVTDDPFGEIRTSLSEYTRLLEQTAAGRSELESYRALHGVESVPKDLPSIDELDRRRAELDAKRRVLSEELALLRREYDRAETAISERDAVEARRQELAEQLEREERTLDIVLLTQKYLTEAKDSLTAKYLGRTKSAFEKYMSLIGGVEGEYDMSTDFGIAKREGGTTRAAEYYSRGTKDLFALCSRLALVDALYEADQPPLLLDDPFTSFDDGRLGAAIRLLRRLGEERQIIYFTCSSARSCGKGK